MIQEPVITNARAKREWDWIVQKVGEDNAKNAINQIGNRKPFPLNIARALSLDLPIELAEEPRHRRDCGDLLAILRSNTC